MLRYIPSLSLFNAEHQYITVSFAFIPTRADFEAWIWVEVDYLGNELKEPQLETGTGKDRNIVKGTLSSMLASEKPEFNPF